MKCYIQEDIVLESIMAMAFAFLLGRMQRLPVCLSVCLLSCPNSLSCCFQPGKTQLLAPLLRFFVVDYFRFMCWPRNLKLHILKIELMFLPDHLPSRLVLCCHAEITILPPSQT